METTVEVLLVVEVHNWGVVRDVRAGALLIDE